MWGGYLADMQSLSKYNKGIKYLLCAIDLFIKYPWDVHLKDKRGITMVNAFQKIISKGRKTNKIWVDQGSEFYSNLFKWFLKINNIEMYSKYSTYNERKFVIVERFIRTLKNKIFKHMTDILNSVYFDVLDDIVNKYNKKVHRTIQMKPVDVTSDSYAEYKIIFAKGYTQNCLEEIFIISKIKNTVPCY